MAIFKPGSVVSTLSAPLQGSDSVCVGDNGGPQTLDISSNGFLTYGNGTALKVHFEVSGGDDQLEKIRVGT